MTDKKEPRDPDTGSSTEAGETPPHDIIVVDDSRNRTKGVVASGNEERTLVHHQETFHEAVLEVVALNKMMSIELAGFFKKLKDVGQEDMIQFMIMAPENFRTLVKLVADLDESRRVLDEVQQSLRTESMRFQTLGSLQVAAGLIAKSSERLKEQFHRSNNDIRKVLEGMRETTHEKPIPPAGDIPVVLEEDLLVMDEGERIEVIQKMQAVVQQHIRSAASVLQQVVREADHTIEVAQGDLDEARVKAIGSQGEHDLLLDEERDVYLDVVKSIRCSIDTLIKIIDSIPERKAKLLLEALNEESLLAIEAVFNEKIALEQAREIGIEQSEREQMEQMLAWIRLARTKKEQSAGTAASLKRGVDIKPQRVPKIEEPNNS